MNLHGYGVLLLVLMRKLTVGSLFSGIGGLELGLEWSGGFETKWQVEWNDYATKVLEKHWPNAIRYRDVREVCGQSMAYSECIERNTGRESVARLSDDDVKRDRLAATDIICGGFPCQDVSLAGRRAGFGDGTTRSGLWYEFARIIGEARPRWILAENVTGLLSSDDGWTFGKVIGDLAALGYNAWWDCLPALSVGAPHRRDRVFIVGYNVADSACINQWYKREHTRAGEERESTAGTRSSSEDAGLVADASCYGLHADVTTNDEEKASGRDTTEWCCDRVESAMGSPNVADSDSCGYIHGEATELGGTCTESSENSRVDFERRCTEQWAIEPDVGRVANGVPDRVDRLRCLGNAVVPHVGYAVGCWILEAERVMRENAKCG